MRDSDFLISLSLIEGAYQFLYGCGIVFISVRKRQGMRIAAPVCELARNDKIGRFQPRAGGQWPPLRRGSVCGRPMAAPTDCHSERSEESASPVPCCLLPRAGGQWPPLRRYLIVVLVSFWITSWAPPSTMLVAETRVSLAFCWNSGMVRAPQLHMVDLTLLRVRATLSFRRPA